MEMNGGSPTSGENNLFNFLAVKSYSNIIKHTFLIEEAAEKKPPNIVAFVIDQAVFPAACAMKW
jgi:hypothetical protein